MTDERLALLDRISAPDDRFTIRLAAVALPLGVLLPLVATAVHPHGEDVMDNPAVFTEYARNGAWFAIHFAQWGAALLLFAGMLGVYHAIKSDSGLARALARFGKFATIQAAAGITALQAVDGVALKWAVDNWADAPPDEKRATFAAAEAVRFIEYGLQAYANVMLGIAVILLGGATFVGRSYPRWLGALASGAGVAWIVHGVMVAFIGLFDSTPRLIGMVLLVLWGLVMASSMWRHTGRSRLEPPAEATAADPQPVTT